MAYLFPGIDSISGAAMSPTSVFMSHAQNAAEFQPTQKMSDVYASQDNDSTSRFNTHVSNSAEIALGEISPVEASDNVKSTIDTTGMWELYDPNSASSSPPSTPQKLEYIDAPYAQHYGMDVSTAYQEALSNTSYQRKVKDLQAAGLNPVLGVSGSGSASFYGTPEASSGGGSSYGSSGSAASNEKNIGKYAPYMIGAGVTLAALLASKNPATAVAAGNSAAQLLSSLNNYLNS